MAGSLGEMKMGTNLIPFPRHSALTHDGNLRIMYDKRLGYLTAYPLEEAGAGKRTGKPSMNCHCCVAGHGEFAF